MRTFRLLALGLSTLGAALAQRVGVPTDDLGNVSVDELFSLEVTSVGRKAQELAKAPAAVFVLTAADIRRSGATSIPEALQVVPGLTVLSLDGRSWTVSARGGARQYANQILVMIDGRSLYTPLFSGVIWDTIDVPLEDVEQIEVVRGPGAVMWGPNAVNGVINIITKSARHTKDGQVSSAGGNAIENVTEARWGAVPNDQIAWRVWGKFTDLTPAYGSPGYYHFPGVGAFQTGSVQDLDSTAGRAGFRVDGQPDEKNQWTIEGDIFKTTRQDPLATPVLYPAIIEQSMGVSNYFGWNVQGRWVHTSSSGVESTLKFSFERTDIDYAITTSDLHNLNINYESRAQTGDRNEFYWGAGYQQYWDAANPDLALTYDPAKSKYFSGDVVARDEWQLVPGLVTASAGIRLNYDSYRQLQYQPSLRLLYTPNPRQSLWFAASRAVRTPNRVDRDFDEYAGAALIDNYPVQLWMLGTKTMRSEVERSLETGYRLQSGQQWSVDLSVYWSYYERLRGVEGTALPALSFPNGKPTLTETVYTCNCGTGRSYGAEIWATWQIRPGWRLSPSYSYLNESRWLPSAPNLQYLWDGDPVSLAHQGVLRSQHDLARNLQFDLTARAHSRDDGLYPIPGALLLDARLAWRPWRTGEFSLTLKNLTGREVMEGVPELLTVAIPIRRTAVFKWTQRF
jgi:iron complex outermembrane recepter protein